MTARYAGPGLLDVTVDAGPLVTVVVTLAGEQPRVVAARLVVSGHDLTDARQARQVAAGVVNDAWPQIMEQWREHAHVRVA